MSDTILFGAGACGKNTLKYMREHGSEPLAFVDNDSKRWGSVCEGLRVLSPTEAEKLYPKSGYVVTIYQACAHAVRQQVRDMGLKVVPLDSLLPVHRGIPSAEIEAKLRVIVREHKTLIELTDQIKFRQTLDFDAQLPASDSKHTYFPYFIQRKTDEVYIDCGAADGDTIREFIKRWPTCKQIIAFEPDRENFNKLSSEPCVAYNCALNNYDGHVRFASSGDMASHVDKNVDTVVSCFKLDTILYHTTPTYIKMDIEGSELAAIEGARWNIATNRPVLAICAYHKAEDLWEIPLRLHELVPSYELRLRRYASGPWELVWYAIPKERLLFVCENCGTLLAYGDHEILYCQNPKCETWR